MVPFSFKKFVFILSYIILTAIISGTSFRGILISLIEFPFYISDVNVVVFYFSYSIFWFFIFFFRLNFLFVGSFLFKKYSFFQEYTIFLWIVVTILFLSRWSPSVIFTEIYTTLIFSNDLNRVRYEFSIFCSNIMGNLIDFYLLGFSFFIIFFYFSRNFCESKQLFITRIMYRIYGVLFTLNYFFGETIRYSLCRVFWNSLFIEATILFFTLIRTFCRYKQLKNKV